MGRDNAVWEAVRYYLRSIAADLGNHEAKFPSKDEILCLRNLCSNKMFAEFVSFEKSKKDLVDRVVKQTLELQMASFPDSNIRNGLEVVKAWQNWGEPFALFLFSLNTASFETIHDVQ